MLTLAHCRELLGGGHGLSDEQVLTVRDQLSALADVVLEICPDLRGSSDAGGECIPERAATREFDGHGRFNEAVQFVPDHDLMEVAERAAIREYESGLGRDVAERMALADYTRRKRRKQ